ncbi:hypothetical protein H4219_005437 [Mycoemilia scoparia]|uniref:26S proteasome complex subunit SEM1 n=1 Tax=Mycoemilia scoparia TaxID=417184 RepID=A0A9W7ZUL4_9FUNG|nr:hypothetical protein H4219_005437 [Mycoemilia scoparia]
MTDKPVEKKETESTTKSNTTTAEQKPTTNVPRLGILEEDDEFEEFPKQATTESSNGDEENAEEDLYTWDLTWEDAATETKFADILK